MRYNAIQISTLFHDSDSDEKFVTFQAANMFPIVIEIARGSLKLKSCRQQVYLLFQHHSVPFRHNAARRAQCCEIYSSPITTIEISGVESQLVGSPLVAVKSRGFERKMKKSLPNNTICYTKLIDSIE